MATPQRSTGPWDATDNPVSTLYHALQGAETYQPYLRNAEQDGNQEPARFYRDVRQEEQRRAERAERLLARRTRRHHVPRARLVPRPMPLDRHLSPTPPGRADQDDRPESGWAGEHGRTTHAGSDWRRWVFLEQAWRPACFPKGKALEAPEAPCGNPLTEEENTCRS